MQSQLEKARRRQVTLSMALCNAITPSKDMNFIAWSMSLSSKFRLKEYWTRDALVGMLCEVEWMGWEAAAIIHLVACGYLLFEVIISQIEEKMDTSISKFP